MGGRRQNEPVSTAAMEVVGHERKMDVLRQKEIEMKGKALSMLSRTAGKIEATNFFKTQADFFTLVMFKQIKDAKEYRDLCGMTWEAFCESVGLKRRTIDENLEDLKPFRADFLAAFRQFSGFDFSKIKYLGYEVSAESAKIEDNAITYRGETIPITPDHADEILALLEQLEEDYKAQLEENAAELKAQKRIATSKEDVIKKMEKEIKRLEHRVDVTDLSPEEQEQVDLLKELQGNIVNLVSTIKQKIPYGNSTETVLRQTYFLYIFCSKVFMEERMALHEVYKDAEEVPWEIMEQELPPTEVLVNETPLTKGMGAGYKEKIEKRKKK